MEGYIKNKFKKGAFFLAITVLIGMTPAMAAEKNLPETLVPMGNTVGIKIQSNGVIVVALSEVETEKGKISPSMDLLPGDLITHVNAEEVHSSQDFTAAVEKINGNPMTVRILRGDRQMQFTLTPAKKQDGAYELGLWYRDNMGGIGTLTYYDPNSGEFGALGHAVSDMQTGAIIPLASGSIYSSHVTSIVKGQSGQPGQLQGAFDLNTEIGKIDANTHSGIFGHIDSLPKNGEAIPVAGLDKIKIGSATILSNIDGTEVKEYQIEISKIYPTAKTSERSMMITVTDERLLQETGGIVQGMSGSPIIQDGKLVGAVTHVLINNPAKGYGISIESMLDSNREHTEPVLAA